MIRRFRGSDLPLKRNGKWPPQPQRQCSKSREDQAAQRTAEETGAKVEEEEEEEEEQEEKAVTAAVAAGAAEGAGAED